MECPSLEDIYDLATDDLRSLEQMLLARVPQTNQDLLDAIVLEIEERKTLQYFAELCHADNPYAKKVTDFNSEFLKLANQALTRNRSIHQEQSQNLEKQLSSTPHDSFIQDNPNNETCYSVPTARQSSSKERQETDTDSRSIKSDFLRQGDNYSVASMKSKSKDSNRTDNDRDGSMTKKMNLGLKKSKKGALRQLVMSTLARTKVDEPTILKRNSAFSPTKVTTFDTRYHVPGEKRPSQEPAHRPPASQKNIHEPAQQKKKAPKVSKEQDAQRKQMLARTEKIEKKTSVKLPKIVHKDLLQMVKDEEAKKLAKTEKKIQSEKQHQEHLPTFQDNRKTATAHSDQPRKYSEEIAQQIEASAGQNDLKTGRESAGEIEEDIVKEVIVEEQIEESVSPNKLQQIMLDKKAKPVGQRTRRQDEAKQLKDNYVSSPSRLRNYQKQDVEDLQQKRQQPTFNNQKQHIQNHHFTGFAQKSDNPSNKTNANDRQKATDKPIEHKQINHSVQEGKNQISLGKTAVDPFQQRVHQNQTKLAPSQANKQSEDKVDYTMKLLEQIDDCYEKQQKLLARIESYESPYQHETEAITRPETTDDKLNSAREEEKKEDKDKKCYSEEYWAHIREQAELKIKRFHQQKQINELKEFSYVEARKPQLDIEDEEQKKTQPIEEDLNAKEEDVLKEEDIKKLKRQLGRKVVKKVVEKPLPAPRVLRPKPQFDYFSVYPTFNHIFSVTYLKNQMQANNEIPNIMRDIKTLFTTHNEHFAGRNTFQPAIFLPFDSTGAFKMTDAKQLLLHAESTYIDLKVLIERVQTFNANLQGQFSDVTKNRYYRVVKTKEEVYDIITTSFLRRKGWKQLPHGCNLRSSWNLFWSWAKPDIDLGKLLVWQRINHYPFNKNLSRKDLLYKNLEHFRKTYRVAMNFLPLTFNLPKQFTQLSVKFHQEQMLNKDQNFWIMKPIGKSRGRGIKVISSLSELNYVDNIVVQKYIANPLLLEGYKFDMRIYVLVTSFHPLQAFVYKEGFARLSTQKYNLDANSIRNAFIHLTNFSVNKNNVEGKSNFSSGSKISMKVLKDKLTRMGYSFSSIWSQVHDIIIKSLLGCSVSVPSFPTAFELFGYDVMIDQEGQCHLIEINSSPSLERSYMLDEIVKQNLIDDIMDIVDPPDFDKAELLDVFSERIAQISAGKKITVDEDLIGLARILRYQPIRRVGEMPAKMGLFERVAPSPACLQIQRLMKGKSGANNPQNID